MASKYVKRGVIRVATDVSMTVVLSSPTSQFRSALIDLLEDVAAGVIANDPTIIAAAEAAVGSALQTTGNGRLSDLGGSVSSTATVKDLDLLPATSGWFRALSTALNRPPGTGAFSVLHLAYSATNAAQIAMSVSGAGETATYVRVKRSDVWEPWTKLTTPADLTARVMGLPTELDLLTGSQHRSPKEGNLDAFRIRDAAGMVSFEVRPDGTLWAARVETPMIVSPSIGTGGSSISCVYAIGVLGQSNPVGKGEPVMPILDGATPRIWELPDGSTSLVPAEVPLSVPGGTGTGLAPAHVLARKLLEHDPNCVVVLVPVAKGGSGLVTDPALGYGKWAVGYTGPNPALYSNAIARMETADTLIVTQFGMSPFTIAHWGQGEADGADGITRSAYITEFDILAPDWLGRFGGVFLITGMVPQAATSGTRPEIQLALQDTPRRLEKTAFIPGIDNGGGAGGPSDVIHYGREAVEHLGRELFEAIPRAANNVAASHTYPPLKVSASKWGSEVTVEWTPPYCRVTSYEVQSSTDGTTWVPVTMAEPIATRVTFTSAAPVKVRVRAIGTETSNWTAPVPAIGG